MFGEVRCFEGFFEEVAELVGDVRGCWKRDEIPALAARGNHGEGERASRGVRGVVG